jgi:hypothetical protein
VNAATFPSMRSRADRFTPGPRGVFLDDTAFFREGRSGAGHATLTPEELGSYRARVAAMASLEVVSWPHRDAGALNAGKAVKHMGGSGSRKIITMSAEIAASHAAFAQAWIAYARELTAHQRGNSVPPGDQQSREPDGMAPRT